MIGNILSLEHTYAYVVKGNIIFQMPVLDQSIISNYWYVLPKGTTNNGGCLVAINRSNDQDTVPSGHGLLCLILLGRCVAFGIDNIHLRTRKRIGDRLC